jgi:hypothetical protein
MRKLMKALVVLSLVVVALAGTAGTAFAAPPVIEDGFVCPVLGGNAGENGVANGIDKSADTGLTFETVVGPEVSVPTQATNGNNGTNNPGGPYASPGDPDYTAIWP